MNRMLLNFRLFSKVLYSFIVLFMIIFFGTLGYMVIEGWSLLDAFYQTIITVSTVVFGEVNDFSSYGKLFTAFLIITSFGTFAYTVTSITSYVVSGDYRRYFREYKFMKEMKDLKEQFLVCNIIGFRNPDGEYDINPSGDTGIVPNSKLFVLGNPEQIKRLNRIFGI